MSIGDKISSFIKNRKMSVDEKIEYLTYLYEEGLDFSAIPDNYASREKVLVKNVIRNIQKLYNNEKLKIKQIIGCEKIGINFEPKTNIEDKIKFLRKAKEEEISIDEIIKNADKYTNNLIFKYVCDIRKSFDRNELNEEQIYKCKRELKIILSNEEKKEIILKKVKESALKNITVTENIDEILDVH